MLYHAELLKEIEGYLAETGMGSTYFGKLAVKNAELVARLRTPGRRIWPETEQQVRRFIRERRAETEAAQ